MLVEFLGNVGYRKGREVNAYLVGMYEGIDEIKRREKVILAGAGENGFIAKKMLESKGIPIAGYADNNVKLNNKILDGKTICLPDTFFDDPDVYFVVSVDERNIAGVRLQFMAHHIESYSIFVRLTGHSFAEENRSIHNALMEGINTICFKDENPRKALPYCGYALGKDGSRLGDVNWLVKSTEWTHPGYLWIYEFLHEEIHGNGEVNILEIGPGYGLMSYVFLRMFPRIKIDGLVFGRREREKLNLALPYERGLDKVQQTFSGRIAYQFGRIEKDEDILKDTYDLIIMTEVFEHFALNPVPTMKKLKDALRPAGRMLLTTPNWGHLPTYRTWRELPDVSETNEDRYDELLECGHVYQYNKDEMEEVIAESGWDIEKYAVSESNNHNYFIK